MSILIDIGGIYSTGEQMWWLFFIDTKLGRSIAITLAIIAGIAVGWGVFATKYYNAGHRAAIAQIAAKDRRTLDAVNQAIEDVDKCNSAHGQWDTTVGMCVKQ